MLNGTPAGTRARSLPSWILEIEELGSCGVVEVKKRAIDS
jgi:hypothetical protein